MSPESLPFILLAFILGIALSAVLMRGRLRAAATSLAEQSRQSEVALGQEKERRISLESENRRIPLLEEQLVRERDNVRMLEGDRARFSSLAGRIPELEKTIEARERILMASQDTNNNLNAELKRLETELRNERDNFDKLKEARQELANQFQTISAAVLASNEKQFLSLAETKLGQYQESAKGDLEKRQQAIQEMVAPLQSKIKDFEMKVDEVYRTEAAERNTLRGEIKSLVELNKQISAEANNLASALKGDAKKQGNWGEVILERVLEFSGLRKGEEYKLQVSLTNEEGRRQQPDAIIYLPDKKHIIVDSKVSLVAYDRYVSAQSDEEREAALLAHIASVKSHIKGLGESKYPDLLALDSPDFTLLFMPIESSFGLAVQADNELFAFAWDRKIIIVSPSTLLATLRTIASIWKQERQTKNAIEIAERAGKLYDKFVGFVEDLVSIGKKMDDTKKEYEGAMNKLSKGTGNLVRQSEQLKEMGAKASKQLPGLLLDRAE